MKYLQDNIDNRKLLNDIDFDLYANINKSIIYYVEKKVSDDLYYKLEEAHEHIYAYMTKE